MTRFISISSHGYRPGDRVTVSFPRRPFWKRWLAWAWPPWRNPRTFVVKAVTAHTIQTKSVPW